MKKINLGDVFGLLTVLKRVKTGKNTKYLCSCTCGNTTEVWGSGLTNVIEPTQSCGCLQLISATKPQGVAAYNCAYTKLQRNALIRQIEFDLTKDEFKNLISQNCTYCGLEPLPYNPYLKRDGSLIKGHSQQSADRAWINISGVDRIDSLRGYTRSNCVSCCPQCNYAKLDYTMDEFINHAYAIVNHQELVKKRSA